MLKLGNKRITLPVIIFLAALIAAGAAMVTVSLRFVKSGEISPDSLTPKLSFAGLPTQYTFTNGGGVTTLTLSADGAFEGVYRQKEERNVNYSTFRGRFAKPEMINEYTYLAVIDEFEKTDEKSKVYEGDEYGYIPADSAGFEKAKDMLVFLPETPLALMHSECIPQLDLEEGADCLPDNMCVIYNYIEDYPFIGFTG